MLDALPVSGAAGAVMRPPLPDVVQRADSHYAGEGLADSVHTYADQCTAAAAADDKWRMAIDEAMVIAHIGVADVTSDPYDCLNRLLEWHHDIWLDPAVSSDAQALIDRGAAAAQARIAELEALVRDAGPAMREYARKNPKHYFGETWQDPNGAHAWLERAALASTSGAAHGA